MSQFYKMDPAAWDFGTASLSLEEEAAYLRIVNAINKHDAPVPNVDRVLAGMFRCSLRKARSLRDALLAVGKIYLEDGMIWNDRARSDVVSRSFRSEKLAEIGAKGGRISGEVRSKSLKYNKPDKACASSRIEENRIDNPPTPLEGEFDVFWKLCPKKVGKVAARRKFDTAVKRGVDPGRITEAMRRYAGSEQVKRGYAKHPTTWLNQGCWDDEPDRRADDGLASWGIRDIDPDIGGNPQRSGHIASPPRRNATDDVPRMLDLTPQESRPMPERDIPAGRGGLALLALRA